MPCIITRSDTPVLRGSLLRHELGHCLRQKALLSRSENITGTPSLGYLRLQTSPGEGIVSAGDLKTERLQFQTVRRLKSEEMAPPTPWGSGLDPLG